MSSAFRRWSVNWTWLGCGFGSWSSSWETTASRPARASWRPCVRARGTVREGRYGKVREGARRYGEVRDGAGRYGEVRDGHGGTARYETGRAVRRGTGLGGVVRRGTGRDKAVRDGMVRRGMGRDGVVRDGTTQDSMGIREGMLRLNMVWGGAARCWEVRDGWDSKERCGELLDSLMRTSKIQFWLSKWYCEFTGSCFMQKRNRWKYRFVLNRSTSAKPRPRNAKSKQWLRSPWFKWYLQIYNNASKLYWFHHTLTETIARTIHRTSDKYEETPMPTQARHINYTRWEDGAVDS